MNTYHENWKQLWKHVRTAGATAALLSLALVGTGGAALASAQSTSPADVVQAFVDASNRGDMAAMSALADPAFGFVEDLRQPGSHTETLAELQGHLAQLTVLSLKQTGVDTVLLDANLSGPSLPPISVPFHESYAVTVSNGRVVRMVETIAPETLSALGSLGSGSGTQAGMPSTGGGSDGMLLTLLALGLAGILALAGGTLARHRSLR
jgi:hypothetical protein